MDFKEFGNKEGKKLVLLPGTACTWQLNFKNIIDELSKKYWIIAVNYDGFEGDNTKVFTDVPTVTSKIEDYILENHDGKIDGAYGSSLGGKVFAKILTTIVSPMLSGACTSEKKRQKLKDKLQKKGAIGEGKGSLDFADSFIDSMASLNPKTITKEFYSDYITPLDDNIDVEGTIIHVIYAKQMGEKYLQRYYKHFKNPDIHEFDMKHEVWLYDDKWMKPVLKCIDDCMK